MEPEGLNKRTYSKNDNINNDYLLFLEYRVSKNINISKNLDKIDEVEMIPNFTNYEVLLKYNYNIKQLKQIAKQHKLKLTGNKTQLVSRIYSYLYLSQLVIKIQKIMRGCLQRKYNDNHGPGFKNRSLCVNNFDFLSMDEVTSIENKQFFSFKDDDGFIYGFDILSLYNLIQKSGKNNLKNPYNRNNIPECVFKYIASIIRISKILNISIDIVIEDDKTSLSLQKLVELRSLELFQNIDKPLTKYTP